MVVNPAATSTTAKMRDVLVGALASELKVDVVETAHRGHGAELGARRPPTGIDLVVSVGGDGTVNEVVNGLLEKGPGAAPADARRRPGRLHERLLPGAGPLAGPGGGDRGDPRLAAGRPHPAGVAGHGPRSGTADAGADGWTDPRWFVFAAGLGFDAEVIARVEAQRAAGRRSTGALYVREATTAFLLGRERRRPAMTLQVPGEPAAGGPVPLPGLQRQPVDLSGRPAGQPLARGVLRRRAGRVRDGPDGPLRMLRTLRQTLAPHTRCPRPRRAPPARPRGGVAHRLAPPGLAGRRRPPGYRDRAAGSARAGGAARDRLTESPWRSLTHVPTSLVNVPPGVWFGRVAGLARPW